MAKRSRISFVGSFWFQVALVAVSSTGAFPVIGNYRDRSLQSNDGSLALINDIIGDLSFSMPFDYSQSFLVYDVSTSGPLV